MLTDLTQVQPSFSQDHFDHAFGDHTVAITDVIWGVLLALLVKGREHPLSLLKNNVGRDQWESMSPGEVDAIAKG